MLKQSDQVGELTAALAKAQSAFTIPAMSAEGKITDSQKFKYAPLDEGIKAVMPALTANGICLTQRPFFEERENGQRYVMLETRLSLGEQWMGMVYPVANLAVMETDRFDPKRIGAYITYARRYSLFAFLGIAGEEDLDGVKLDERSNGNGKGKPTALKPLVGEEATNLKGTLLEDIKELKSLQDCLAWARDSRAIKNRLPTPDQAEIDKAFDRKQDELRD